MSNRGKRGRLRGIGAGIGLACAGFLAWTCVAAPLASSQDVKTAAAPVANPFDQPLAILYESRNAYAGVRDYTCTVLKRETIPGNPDDNIIQLKFREQPFSVYSRWIAPAKFRGQEVAYMHGRNRNKLRVHAKGFLKGIAGFVSVDVDDPRVRECSRHNIYEAGIGYLIERTIQHWEGEKKSGNAKVRVEEYEYNKRRCYRVETTQIERRTDSYCYRSVLYVDQESKLPIRNENYSWPRAGGPADGDLIEMFAFIDLRVNVGFTDRDFDK